MSKLSQAKITQYIREQLGLSQSALAQYLSITLSQLAMYETGKRELPLGTSVKLADFLLFLNQEENVFKQEKEILRKQENQVQEFLQQHIKNLEFKQIKEQQKLEAIQKKYYQSVKLKAFGIHLENSKSTLFDLVKILADDGIEKNGLVDQTRQLLKLESINSQLAYCKSVKEKQMKS